MPNDLKKAATEARKLADQAEHEWRLKKDDARELAAKAVELETKVAQEEFDKLQEAQEDGES